MSLDYHDNFKSKQFVEVMGPGDARPPRVVEVTEDQVYDVQTLVTSGRGKGKSLRIPRKQLVDPTRWKLLDW